MEKVKITQEQADAIEGAIKEHGKDDVVDIHCLKQKNQLTWVDPFEALNELEMWKLAKSVYRGYEVEPEFEVGDFVIATNKNNEKVYEVNSVSEKGGVSACYNAGCIFTSKNNWRHATKEEIAQEKERRWWAVHGREVWELREGDVLRKTNHRYDFIIVSKVSGDAVWFGTNKDCDSIDWVKSKCEVACFVENRLDVKS